MPLRNRDGEVVVVLHQLLFNMKLSLFHLMRVYLRGALDGTYIGVRVCRLDKTRYRNHKGEVSINVLAVCDENMNFIYLFSGYEGSTADSRVLRDAISWPNGLRVPTGNYYLVDNGYTNGDGFLAPYRGSGTRYHLYESGEGRNAPQNYKEYFNLKHLRHEMSSRGLLDFWNRDGAFLGVPRITQSRCKIKL